MARWAQMELEFLGRIDHQVQIRGYRVEVEEIETVLEEHPSVRSAVVEARTDGAGEVRLACYVVWKGGGDPLRLMVAIPQTKRLASVAYEAGRASGCRTTWCLRVD